MKHLFALALLLGAGAAEGHRSSDAFLVLATHGARFDGQWEIALRDLAVLAEIDRDGDRALTWGELRAAEAPLRDLVGEALLVAADGTRCAFTVGELRVRERSDGVFAWFPLSGTCPRAIAVLRLDYRLLFELDPGHRGLLALRAGDVAHAAVFSPAQPQLAFTLGSTARARLFAQYLREGARHIWIGLDHVLFLLALLLPCVLRRTPGRWQREPALRPVLWGTASVVTAFTCAHSVTLTLAALGMLAVPGAVAESAIALSVLLAALNNLRPVVTRMRWAVALLFGLIHGVGFAGVLGELGLPDGARLLALLAFNLGVELGQLVIVAVAVPVAFALARSRAYPKLMAAGSLAVAGLALWWLLERGGLIA